MEVTKEKLLATFYKLGLDKKLNVSPTQIEIEFTAIEDNDNPYSEWFIEDDMLRVTIFDIDESTGIKAVGTRFAVLSLGLQKFHAAILIHILLALCSVLLYRIDIPISTIIIYCWIMVFTYPFTWAWAFKSSGLYEARIKFQMMETGLIYGEEELELHCKRQDLSNWGTGKWIGGLLGVEFFLLFLILTLPILM